MSPLLTSLALVYHWKELLTWNHFSRDWVAILCWRNGLHGNSQNQKESFYKKIWDRIPKTKYAEKKTFQVGVCDAVANLKWNCRNTRSFKEMRHWAQPLVIADSMPLNTEKKYLQNLLEKSWEARRNQKVIISMKNNAQLMHGKNFRACNFKWILPEIDFRSKIYLPTSVTSV